MFGKKNSRLRSLVALLLFLFVAMLCITPATFFAAIGREWKTRGEIKALREFSVVDDRAALDSIGESKRVLDIIVTDSNGAVLYTVNSMPMFAHEGATVTFDNVTGLFKFSGSRVFYFQNNDILDALIEIGDNDLDLDDDYAGKPSFDEKFVEDNTYQTILLPDNNGNFAYIVCTQDSHVGLILYIVFISIAWFVLISYALCVGAYAVVKLVVPVCPSCSQRIRFGLQHCTKCGVSLAPKRCPTCQTVAKKGDVVCGSCGTQL